MSIPPQYAATRTEAVEDCRDFLRTGRCKYGASCKYNHPPNVQSGGGMKAPLDPSEPMFPVRPGEAVCQYYMKHGTCKFGQACKFHHPPQMTQQVVGGGNVVMMNVVRQDPQRLLVNPTIVDNPSVMLQFLPQRPDEPDCIYFLKNGRCKYGPTCRYHHPLNYHQRRAEEQRRHHEQRRNQATQQVHYVSQPVVGFPQGHVFVSDQPVTYVNVAGDTHQGYHQPLSILQGPVDGTITYSVPVGSTVGTEQGSSASSIASSFDTSGSNLEAMAHGEGLWKRRNESGGSLNTYSDTRNPSRVVLPHSASDGNIARRNRAPSYGSAGDPAAYYGDANGMSRIGSTGSWRSDSHGVTQYNNRSAETGDIVTQQEKRSPSMRVRSAGTGQSRRARLSARSREGEEAFTMMTSALLNMLDTPEEVIAESNSDEDVKKPADAYSGDHVDPSLFQQLTLNASQAEDYRYHNGGAPPSWTNLSSSAAPAGTTDSHRIRMRGDTQPQQPPPGHPPFHPTDPDAGLYFP